jgi:hypothetical protein
MVSLTVLMKPQISWSSVVGKFFHFHHTVLISPAGFPSTPKDETPH